MFKKLKIFKILGYKYSIATSNGTQCAEGCVTERTNDTVDANHVNNMHGLDGEDGMFTCYACGSDFDPNGWTGLCDRSCYYVMRTLLYNYESGKDEEPDDRVVAYFTSFPDGGGHSFYPNRILSYIASYEADNEEDEEDQEDMHFTCYACGTESEPNGWTGLCDRGCYYDMCGLLYDYESGKTEEPDDRVVGYFTAYPDGGGHMFYPDRILKYIEDNQDK